MTPKRQKLMVVYGCNKRLEPQTRALSHWPDRNAVNAESSANNPLLHAVSTENDGPIKPKQYEILQMFFQLSSLDLHLQQKKSLTDWLTRHGYI